LYHQPYQFVEKTLSQLKIGALEKVNLKTINRFPPQPERGIIQIIIFERGDSSMRIINFVAGFIVGAGLAAIAVLLTTPQSGSDLQENIRTRVDGMVDESRKAYTARRAALEDQLTSLKSGGGGQPTP
jgi:hypothetical protein